MTWTRADSNFLADIIWWIKGRMHDDSFNDFYPYHIEALRKARAELDEQLPRDGE